MKTEQEVIELVQKLRESVNSSKKVNEEASDDDNECGDEQFDFIELFRDGNMEKIYFFRERFSLYEDFFKDYELIELFSKSQSDFEAVVFHYWGDSTIEALWFFSRKSGIYSFEYLGGVYFDEVGY